jgi:endo-1,3(4)-beta-glucanase
MASLMEALRERKRPARRGSMHSRHQPFPSVENHAAPCPSGLWADHLRAPPYPTNAPWQNFVLNKGTCRENLHPFLVQAQEDALAVCYPPRAPAAAFIFTPFTPDLTFRVLENCGHHVVSHYDDLSVTLLFSHRFGVPLVQGSPYITICVDDGTPAFSTVHAILGFWANSDRTKHRITLNNNQTWLVYSSHPLPLSRELLQSETPFQGVIRITTVSGLEQGEDDESLLDKYRACYPIGGEVSFFENSEVVYKWETQGAGDLLMLTLPQHREIMSQCYTRALPALRFRSLDGVMEGVVGHKWGLAVRGAQLRWYSATGIHDAVARSQVGEALDADVRALAPVTTPSTYFHGKALARAARLALIADELHLSNLVAKVVEFLQKSLTPWLLGQFPGNAFLYDTTWGGIISRDGSRDPGADFGLGLYNDHHFHLGYFVYAGTPKAPAIAISSISSHL